jgi:hypothetical protein
MPMDNHPSEAHQKPKKRDWSKYAGLSREEVNRRIEEEDKKPIRDFVAGLEAQAQEARRKREAEAEEKRRQQQEKQRAEARSKLEGEKQRQRQQWLDAGGDDQSFSRAWPQIEQQLLMSKLMTHEERVRRTDTTHYDAGVVGGPPLGPGGKP